MPPMASIPLLNDGYICDYVSDCWPRATIHSTFLRKQVLAQVSDMELLGRWPHE